MEKPIKPMDQRSEAKRREVMQSAIDRVMAARRAIVDVRIDRKTEDEILNLTSAILDKLESSPMFKGNEE